MEVELVTLCKRLSMFASVITFLVGLTVLLSWVFDIGSITRVIPSTGEMKANTAACFVLLGTSLFILRGESRRRKISYCGYVCAGLVMIAALLTLVEYVTGWDIGIDQLLVKDHTELATTFAPGRMSPGTAISFLMLGVALILLGARRAFSLMQDIVVLALLYSLLTLVGYIYGASSLYNILPHVAIALHTAAAFMLLSFGILWARPESGLTAALTSPGVSGLMLRRLLPAAICLPIVIGWLRLVGQRAGYYDAEFGQALFTLANVIIFAALTLLTARLAHRLDAERSAAELALREAHEGMEARVKERTAELEASNVRLSLEMTERAKAEEALRRRDEQLRQTQKIEAVGRLAGGIAHQFNNLMTAVIGFSDLLLMRKTESDPDFGKIEEIKKAGQRAAALTSQLLTFSRRQVHTPNRLDVNQVIAGLDEMLRGVLGKEMKLETSLEPCLGKVMADRAQLEEIVVNLTINARDAMKPGGLLTIRTSNVCFDGEPVASAITPGDYVLLSACDTGSGIDPETQARIFEPFFTTRPQGQGTGLGLAVIDGIVKQSGGYIEVVSAPGEGATFNLYFPRLEESQDQP